MNKVINRVHQGAAWFVTVTGIVCILTVGMYLALATFAYCVNREVYYDLPVNGRLALLVMAMLVWITAGSWNKKLKLEKVSG